MTLQNTCPTYARAPIKSIASFLSSRFDDGEAEADQICHKPLIAELSVWLS